MANENIQELKFQVGEVWKGVYSSSTPYGLANVVQDPTGLSVYRSLKSGNVGHPVSDRTWWFCIIDMSSIKAESDRIAALNQAIAQDEALRVAAEELRQQHETERIAAETQRNEAEQARISAEQARVNAESARETAEQQRITAEQGRVSAESARVQAEQARVLAETLRANAEDQRAANEQNRIAAEQQRIERAEQDHQRAESDHATYVDSLGAFDISSYHATDGVLAKYADLTAALGTNGANIPDDLRKGGMSVKFVQSSDNKYVQYRLMADSWSATPSDWQGVDDEPIAGSRNLVESGGVHADVEITKMLVNGSYVFNKTLPTTVGGWKYYVLDCFDFSAIGKVYNLTFAIAESTAKVVRLYATKNGTREQINAYRDGNTATITIANDGTSKIEIVNPNSDSELTVTLTITTNTNVATKTELTALNNKVNGFETDINKANAGVDNYDELIKGAYTQSFNFEASPGVVTYKPVTGITYKLGYKYTITAFINESGGSVRIYTTTNNVKTLVNTIRTGQNVLIEITEGLTAIELGSTTAVSGSISITLDKYLLNRIEKLEELSLEDRILKYPFSNNATFKKGSTDASYLKTCVKDIKVYGCRRNRSYYIYDCYKSTNGAGKRIFILYEKYGDTAHEFVRIQISGDPTDITIESIETENLRLIIDWTNARISPVNYTDSTAPISELCLNYLPESSIELLIPQNLRVVTGTELSIYNQMAVSNIKEDKIFDITASGFTKHKRFIRYIPSDSSNNITNASYKVQLCDYNKSIISKKFNIYPVKSTAGGNKTLNVLCIGGSTTQQGYYIEHLNSLFENDQNLSINLLGTITSTAGELCEGRSGWRARTYFTLNGTADGKSNFANPFFNSDYNNFDTQAFDFSKYMNDQGYTGCDVVIFAFGGNDSAQTTQDIEYAHTYYDAMIASFKAYNPNIIIGIWMYNGGFYQYEGNLTEIDIRQELHKYVLDWYDNRENENIYILPISLNVDPLYDYPYQEVNTSARNDNFKEINVTDWVHVNANTGAWKMADVCYSYIKYFSTLPIFNT